MRGGGSEPASPARDSCNFIARQALVGSSLEHDPKRSSEEVGDFMKMRLFIATIALFAAPSATLAVSCPARVPAAIPTFPASSLKCQATIAKEGGKFVKKQMKTMAKCLLSSEDCPDSKALDKITKAGGKATDKIVGKCPASEFMGLTSGYASEDAATLASCVLSQHNAEGRILAIANTGWFNDDNRRLSDDANKESAKCTKEVSNSTTKYVSKAHKIITKCIATQIKKDTVAVEGLVAQCIGQHNGTMSAFTPPLDTKTADQLAKLEEKTTDKVAKKCATANAATFIPAMFACAGSASVADLQSCVVCGGWDVVLSMIEQEFAENATFISPGPGALENTLGLTAGTVAAGKYLVKSGTYEEGIVLDADDVQIVGCGGATDDRPLITPPDVNPPARGIVVTDRSNLLFQSLEVGPWQADGILTTGVEGVSFRDVFGNGGSDPTVQGSGSVYSVFPVLCNNVLVEGCDVRDVHDAGIYVGESTNIVVRHNLVADNTAGIEIENSGNANVYNNFGTGNTGGLLVFKLQRPTQIGACHEIHHNFLEGNNRLNNGPGTVGLIPPGTGMVVLTNDASTFEYNVSRENKTFGFLGIDQVILNAIIDPDPFNPPVPDPDLDDNWIRYNVFDGNGYDGDPFAQGLEADWLFLASGTSTGNCKLDNFVSDGSPGLGGICVAGPPDFPGCPLPSVLP
jgi:parallel beta-helix repeat protein